MREVWISPHRRRLVPSPAPRTRCAHLGEETRRLDCETCGGKKNLPVHVCTVHGECSPEGVLTNGGRRYTDCRSCRLGGLGYEPAVSRPRWVSTAQLTRDAVTLAGLLPPNCSGVVGVPRSGMIPAAVVATHLHLPLYELTPRGPRELTPGSRGGSLARPAGPLAVIDDTAYSGGALARARAAMRGRAAVYCVVYARPEAKGSADLYAVELPSPHILEWNVLNNGPAVGRASDPFWRGGVGLDFDGVVCHDDESGGRAGTPYLLPRSHEIKLIATGRPGLLRDVTESWLRQWGCRWARMEMVPGPCDVSGIIEHKARHYGASDLGLFIESDPIQAEAIHKATGKPVACPRANQVWA